MGDATLRRYAARPARLAGYHRSFLHRSERRWGRPEAPCPILGLAPGGECWGLVFSVPDEDRRTVLSDLGKREAAAERRRETVTAETPDGPVPAWVWLSRRASHAGEAADLAAVESRLRAAHGVVGTGTEYVRTLVHAMALHGIRDPLIDGLWERLQG
jgi:cation transport protein ChaC